jgi:hypothetical protein
MNDGVGHCIQDVPPNKYVLQHIENGPLSSKSMLTRRPTHLAPSYSGAVPDQDRRQRYLHAPKIVRLTLDAELNDFMLAMLDPEHLTVVVRVSNVMHLP